MGSRNQLYLCDSDADDGDVDGGEVSERVADHEGLLLPRLVRQAPQHRLDLPVGEAHQRREAAYRPGNLKDSAVLLDPNLWISHEKC